MANTRKISYWTIQIIVWSFLTGVIAYAYWVSGNELKLELWQVIVDFSVVILLAIFWVLTITGIYITIAYYIKKWKNRNAPKVEIDDYYNY